MAVYVLFVVDSVSPVQVFLGVLRFPPVRVIAPLLHIHSFVIGGGGAMSEEMGQQGMSLAKKISRVTGHPCHRTSALVWKQTRRNVSIYSCRVIRLQDKIIKVANKPFENVILFKYW
jgi:hypothetical protein